MKKALINNAFLFIFPVLFLSVTSLTAAVEGEDDIVQASFDRLNQNMSHFAWSPNLRTWIGPGTIHITTNL